MTQNVINMGRVPAEPSIKLIQRVVAAEFGLAASDIVDRFPGCRRPHITLTRQIAVWMASDMTTRPKTFIGKMFNLTDNKSVNYCIEKVERMKAEDDVLAQRIRTLQARIRSTPSILRAA